MHVISTQEAAADLIRLLASVEAGEEIIIARGQKPVAKLVPFTGRMDSTRPKVGEMISPPFEVSEAALEPLSSDELKPWGI